MPDTADARLARIEQSLEDLKYQLLGNGRAGRLDEMEGDIQDLKDSRARFRGGMSVLGALVAALGVPEILHWLRGRP